ncbi:LysE family translocator [Pseudomonas cavernicola]|uniref:LysE family translocator n=1 Tax=Pseudomonas cavernicola TaxID=2320866 RepID=A0A418XB02_9PSED|nr:LysE family translocator [Pseudomonas cavernicola]RJG09650.1 LysE family translocator [Pseudomonas cavernicola]
MQETSVLLTLTAVFAVALVSPGPDVALVVRTALHQGRRAGLLSALGLACGILVHGTLVLAGVSVLLGRSPLLFGLLQLLGACYLGWLGYGALCAFLRRGASGGLDGTLAPSRLGPWLRGLATNLLNPKALVFFLALLSSLIPADISLAGKVAVASMLFGMGLGWFSLLSVILTQPAMQRRLLRAVPAIDALCGLVFLLVALGIVLSNPWLRSAFTAS